MIASPPWILQYNSAGSFEWSSRLPGWRPWCKLTRSKTEAVGARSSQWKTGRIFVCWATRQDETAFGPCPGGESGGGESDDDGDS